MSGTPPIALAAAPPLQACRAGHSSSMMNPRRRDMRRGRSWPLFRDPAGSEGTRAIRRQERETRSAWAPWWQGGDVRLVPESGRW
jgi:hypothetical protein